MSVGSNENHLCSRERNLKAGRFQYEVGLISATIETCLQRMSDIRLMNFEIDLRCVTIRSVGS